MKPSQSRYWTDLTVTVCAAAVLLFIGKFLAVYELSIFHQLLLFIVFIFALLGPTLRVDDWESDATFGLTLLYLTGALCLGWYLPTVYLIWLVYLVFPPALFHSLIFSTTQPEP